MKRLPATPSIWLDRLFGALKWPTAVAALGLFPGAVFAMAELLMRVAARPYPISIFLIGFVLYFVFWWKYFRRSRFALVLTFEHELTHALFALATFHSVTGLRATAYRGGHITFVGEGNWLITIAPYFFPTLSLILLPLLSLLPNSLVGVGNFLVGASFAYHVTSTWRQTHPGQTDIQQAGFMFCLFFLPTANIVTFGALLGFVYGGWQGSAQFMAAIWQRSLDIFV